MKEIPMHIAIQHGIRIYPAFNAGTFCLINYLLKLSFVQQQSPGYRRERIE